MHAIRGQLVQAMTSFVAIIIKFVKNIIVHPT